PYLVIAAMIASGLDGVDSGMTLEEPYPKSAYDGDLPRVSDTLRSALDDFSSSAFNRASFGDDVVDHYANMAKVELDAFNRSVTDWERFRSFERM
ncbi:glutamate-ammonia ligase, partial [mine drainage metagenome]